MEVVESRIIQGFTEWTHYESPFAQNVTDNVSGNVTEQKVNVYFV